MFGRSGVCIFRGTTAGRDKRLLRNRHRHLLCMAGALDHSTVGARHSRQGTAAAYDLFSGNCSGMLMFFFGGFKFKHEDIDTSQEDGNSVSGCQSAIILSLIRRTCQALVPTYSLAGCRRMLCPIRLAKLCVVDGIYRAVEATAGGACIQMGHLRNASRPLLGRPKTRL